MDISLIVIIWVIISIAQAINDRKKAPPPPVPPPQDSTDLKFEIPTLANDPNQSAEVEEFAEVTESEETEIAEIYRQRKLSMQTESAAEIQPALETVEEKHIEIDLTPAAMLNSIIMNEILDKPKSLRRRKF